MLSIYKNLGRPAYVIVAATVVNRFGDFVMPFLALFLSTRLGYDAASTGLTVMFVSSGRFVGAWLGGRIADRLGRRRILLLSYAVSGIAVGLSGFFVQNSDLLPLFFGLLVVNSIVQGALRPVLRSMLTDLSSSKRRKDLLSLNYLGINIGVALGPLIAGLLFENHLPWIFWGDAISSTLAAVLILLFVPESRPETDDGLENEELFDSQPPLKAFFSRPLLLFFTFGLFFQGFVYSQFGFSIPLHLEALFSDGAVKFSQIMSLNAVLVLILTPLFTKLTARGHPLLMSSIASGFYCVGFGVLAFEPAYWIYLLSTVIWTSGEIVAVINQQAYFTQLTPGNYRGQFNSYMSIFTGISYFSAPLVGGLFIQAVGHVGMWIAVTLASLIAVIGFYLLYKFEGKLRYRPPTSAHTRESGGEQA